MARYDGGFEGAYYAIGKRGSEAGVLLRSDDGLGPFEKGYSVAGEQGIAMARFADTPK